MNVLYLTANPQEAAIIGREIANAAPDIHLEASYGLQDASALPSNYRSYDGILVDANPPNDAESVLAQIRQTGHSGPVIALINAADEVPPLKLLRLGANDYVVKSGAYYSPLAARLRAAIARREWARQMPTLTPAEVRLRLIIEAIPAAVIRLNGEGTILALNRSGLALIGATQVEEIVARNLLILLPEMQKDSVRLFLDHVCAGERGSIQFNWDALDGRMRRFELFGVPLQAGGEGVANVLGVLTDITQASQIQQDLAGSKERLEQLQRELQQAEAPKREMAETLQTERRQWETERQKFEQQAKEAEDRAAQLREMSQLLESNLGELAGKYAAEQAHSEARNQSLELQLKNGAAEIAQLEHALHTSDSHQSEMAEKFAQEQMQWESARRELELQVKTSTDRIAELMQHLQIAEKQSAELIEQSSRDRSQKDEFQKELQKQIQFAQLLETRQAELSREYEEQYARLKISHDELQRQWEEIQSQRASLEISLQTALEQQERIAAEKNADEAERVLLQQALHASDSNYSEMADKFDQEQMQWESARQELELQVKTGTDRIAELMQHLQIAEKQSAELIEQSSRDRSQKDEFQKELQKQIQFAQLLETRQAELSREYEEQYARLKISHDELQRQREEIQSQRASLEISLQTALEQQERIAAEKNAAEAERVLLQQALHASDSNYSEMADKFDQEQMQWESARQELGLQVITGTDRIAELMQHLQIAEKQSAELIEQSSRDRSQRDELQKELEKQIQLAQLLEERQIELGKEPEEFAQLRISYGELQRQLEETQSQRASLEISLQTALEQRERLVAEKNADTAERTLLEQALRISDSRRSEMAEKYAQEQTQWESARQELELHSKNSADRNAELLQQLQAAEIQIAELFEQSTRDRKQTDELQNNLEQQIQLARLLEERQVELSRGHEERYTQLNASHGEFQNRLEAVQSQKSALETALQKALEQQEKRAAEKIVLEAERTRLEQALRISDLRQSNLAEKYAQEQTQWESARQELELRLKNSADRNAELLQRLQAAEIQIAELCEQSARDRKQTDELQKNLERQIQLARLLEERQVELSREHEERYTQLNASHGELQNRLEAVQSQRSALETALQAALDQQEKLAGEMTAAEAGWNDELQALQNRVQTLAVELQESITAREKMAGLLAEDELRRLNASPSCGSGSQDSPVSHPVDLTRVHRLLDDTENRYESFVRHQSDSHQKLLSDVLTHAQRDNEEWKRILSAQNAGEREYLELMLHKAESRIQRIEEQHKKEREQLEHKLRAHEDRCLRLSEFCLAGLSVSSLDGRILDCDDAFARMLGYNSAEEVMARPNDETLKALARQESSGGRLQARGEGRRVEICVRRQDGRLIWLLENVALISQGGEASPVVERIIVDATERRQLYGEIRRVRRIEAVAQLAAAAVHEFRNILNSTIEYSSFALQSLNEHDPRRARAEQIREIINRAGSLAQQLSEVIQRQGSESAGLDASQVLDEMTSVLRLLAGDDVNLSITPGIGIGAVAIERSKFEQIITALVVAARDCLPAGGAVSVELSSGEIDSTAASYPSLLLTVGSTGYDVLPPQRTSTLDHLVASCQGQLHIGGISGSEACYKLFLPLIG